MCKNFISHHYIVSGRWSPQQKNQNEEDDFIDYDVTVIIYKKIIGEFAADFLSDIQVL